MGVIFLYSTRIFLERLVHETAYLTLLVKWEVHVVVYFESHIIIIDITL